jgi:hypothetical protein
VGSRHEPPPQRSSSSKSASTIAVRVLGKQED